MIFAGLIYIANQCLWLLEKYSCNMNVDSFILMSRIKEKLEDVYQLHSFIKGMSDFFPKLNNSLEHNFLCHLQCNC